MGCARQRFVDRVHIVLQLRFQGPHATLRSLEWQAAGEAVIMAAEDRGPLMHAHVGMMLALHGAMPMPECDPLKTKIGAGVD